MPQATTSSNAPEQTQQESAVQKHGCRQFNTSRTCTRSKKGGICQFAHDPRLRAKALKEKREAIKAAKKAKNTNTETSTETSGNLQNVITQAAQTSKAPTKPSPKPAAPPSLNNTPETPVQNEVLPVPDGHCRHFLRKDCKLEYCTLVHDHAARREYKRSENKKAAKKRKKPVTQAVPLKENIPLPGSKSASRTNRSSDCDINPIPITSGPTTNFGFQSWDSMTLKRWAVQNLSPLVLDKYLKSYGTFIERGKIPLAAIFGTVEPKKTKKNRKNALQPSTHFHLFNSLPYELRDQIWKFYLDTDLEQCVIALKRKTSSDGTDKVGFRRLSLLPTPLEVCHQLRELALKRYELSFGTRHHKPRAYFNYQNNRLFICNDGQSDVLESAKALRTSERQRVRLLALPLRDWLKGSKIDFAKGIAGFTNLRSLHILIGNSVEDEEYLKISAKILEKIQQDVWKVWKANNGPERLTPKIHILVIPAFTAKQHRINALRW